MTPLREHFIRELALRGMAERTVEAYVTAVASPAQHYHRSPDRITDAELQAYLLDLCQVRHLAPSSRNQHLSGLRCFYDLVLHRRTSRSPPARTTPAVRLSRHAS